MAQTKPSGIGRYARGSDAVRHDGPAAERGIRSGDVILDVGGKAVSNPSDVRQAVSDARSSGRHDVLMRIKSGNSTRFVALPVATG